MSQRNVEVVNHNPRWAESFAEEKSALEVALDGVAIAIHHIGSTAVAGLAAKPILDILVEINHLDELNTRTSALESLGYRGKGENGMPGRRYFQKGGARRSHHLHVFLTGDPHLVRHLAFRDYLTAHPNVKDEYARLKKTLAGVYRDSPKDYQEGKSEFVRQHQELALRWFSRGS
jgi:GrpB-like predicted nucleotidyltransferase (UPF0157 family)